MTNLSKTSAHTLAVNSIDQFRNHHNGFVTDKQAHKAFNKAYARQTAPSKAHKKTISRLRVKRQGKGWDFVNGEIAINDRGDGSFDAPVPLDAYHKSRPKK